MMSNDPDKSSQSGAPAGSKGLKDFFRKRKKSTSGGSTLSPDDVSTDGDSSRLDLRQDSPPISQPPKSPVDSPPCDDGTCASAYGNYLTISGTGANVLRDLFNKRYRSSARAGASGSLDVDSKSAPKKSSQAPVFRFRPKKESIVEEEDGLSCANDGIEPLSKSTDSKGLKDYFRNRHKSGPITAMYSVDGGIRSGSKGSSPAPGARMRTFFDSFRQRTKSESVSSEVYPGDLAVAGAINYYKVSGRKKKKFKVTKLAPAERDSEFGPQDFVELFRSRASSDPRSEARLAAQGNRIRKLSDSPLGSRSNSRFQPLQLVIWRDRKKGTHVFRLPRRNEEQGLEDIGDDGSEALAFARFMNTHTCYDVIPNSSKLVIFDTQLSVKKAFFALVQNGIRAAPLWDSYKQDFIGMLTVTDFIQILQKYYKSPQERMAEVEEHRIAAWKEVLRDYDRPGVALNPDESLLNAVRSLCHHKVHRLLIVDSETGNALHILTHKRILKFLHRHMSELKPPEFMQRTLDELQIGTYDNVATATPNTPLIEALNMFAERRVSALPVVDAVGRVVDIYAKYDTISLAAEKLYNNLDVTISEGMKKRREGFEGVHTCRKSETLQAVINRLVDAEVHRLVVVDDCDRVEGIVSLSDILQFLIVHPLDLLNQRVEEADEQFEMSPRILGDLDLGEPTSKPPSLPDDVGEVRSCPDAGEFGFADDLDEPPEIPPGTPEPPPPTSQTPDPSAKIRSKSLEIEEVGKQMEDLTVVDCLDSTVAAPNGELADDDCHKP